MHVRTWIMAVLAASLWCGNVSTAAHADGQGTAGANPQPAAPYPRAAGATAPGAGASPRARDVGLRGEYVEARSASVFAGACHYAGEIMSDGREALMAWHIQHGMWDGVALDGLSAVAVMQSDSNLAQADAVRHATVYVEPRATPRQRAALVAALRSHGLGAAPLLVRVGAIDFAHGADGAWRVTAPDDIALQVSPLPDAACCKQPNLVWYRPLTPLSAPRVGFTDRAIVGGDAPWSRANENGAFYGAFAW